MALALSGVLGVAGPPILLRPVRDHHHIALLERQVAFLRRAPGLQHHRPGQRTLDDNRLLLASLALLVLRLLTLQNLNQRSREFALVPLCVIGQKARPPPVARSAIRHVATIRDSNHLARLQ